MNRIIAIILSSITLVSMGVITTLDLLKDEKKLAYNYELVYFSKKNPKQTLPVARQTKSLNNNQSNDLTALDLAGIENVSDFLSKNKGSGALNIKTQALNFYSAETTPIQSQTKSATNQTGSIGVSSAMAMNSVSGRSSNGSSQGGGLSQRIYVGSKTLSNNDMLLGTSNLPGTLSPDNIASADNIPDAIGTPVPNGFIILIIFSILFIYIKKKRIDIVDNF